jgi:hypothetical protein
MLEWAVDTGIPLVICEVKVGTTMEPTMMSVLGSKTALPKYRDMVAARRSVNRSCGLYQSDLYGQNTMVSALLVRESDYPLLALQHGAVRRGWRYYMNKIVDFEDAYAWDD